MATLVFSVVSLLRLSDWAMTPLAVVSTQVGIILKPRRAEFVNTIRTTRSFRYSVPDEFVGHFPSGVFLTLFLPSICAHYCLWEERGFVKGRSDRKPSSSVFIRFAAQVFFLAELVGGEEGEGWPPYNQGQASRFWVGTGVGWGEGESYMFSLSLKIFESVQKLICRWNWNSLKRLLICRILLSSCLKCTLAVFFLSSLVGPLLHPLFPLLNKIILALLSLLRRKGG